MKLGGATGNVLDVTGETRTRTKLLLAGLGLTASILLLAPSLAGAAKTKIVSSTSTLPANDTPRKTVLCPKGDPAFKFPYGGGSYSTDPYDADGGGVYPHSYERLGVQGGYHVTPVNYDPSPDTPTARQVTLQVICGPEPGKLNPPHVTAQVDPGQVKTHNIRCTGKRKLIGGGFQRTTFVGPIRGAPPSGVFATESRPVAANVWRVSGEAFGKFGGELTGFGYCRKKGGMSTVRATTMIAPGMFGTATTPPCPGKKSMVFSGWTTSPLGSIFYAGGPFNQNDTTTGGGYNRSLASAFLTVEGYCLPVRPIL